MRAQGLNKRLKIAAESPEKRRKGGIFTRFIIIFVIIIMIMSFES